MQKKDKQENQNSQISKAQFYLCLGFWRKMDTETPVGTICDHHMYPYVIGQTGPSKSCKHRSSSSTLFATYPAVFRHFST